VSVWLSVDVLDSINVVTLLSAWMGDRFRTGKPPWHGTRPRSTQPEPSLCG